MNITCSLHVVPKISTHYLIKKLETPLIWMMPINVHDRIRAFLLIGYQEKIPLNLSTCVPLDVKLTGVVLMQ